MYHRGDSINDLLWKLYQVTDTINDLLLKLYQTIDTSEKECLRGDRNL